MDGQADDGVARTADTDATHATVATNTALPGRFLDVIRAALPDERVVEWSEPGASTAAILVVHNDDTATVARSITPAVRWVHVLKAGVDAFPFAELGDRVLTCARGAGSVPIAEWVMATILARAKRLPESWITEPPPQWNLAPLDHLADQTVGLVGIGAIGSEVARRALAFDMEVVAHRRTSAASPVEGVTVVGSLTELLARSDHVVLTAPATPDTRHLIDADALASMKPSAHLVNIARGSLIDQDALLEALDAGHLALASLDVMEPEPLPAGHPLYAHPKVRVSAHISWASPLGLTPVLEQFVENVRRHRAGEELLGVVDVGAGY